MNKYLIVLLALFFSCKQHYTTDNYIISNVNIIDPIDGLKENVSIEIKGNRIIKIGDTELSTSVNKVIDGTGKYIIPGLWDCHVHLAFFEDLSKHMPEMFLSQGITSLRDTGGDFTFLDSIRQRSVKRKSIFPRIKIAGPLIDGNYSVYNGDPLPKISIRTRNVPETIRETEKLVSGGVDFLKAYEMLSPKQFEAVAKIAKKNNLRLAGHVPLSMDIVSATKLGLNSLEHLKNIELSSTSDSDSLLAQRRKMLENPDILPGVRLRGKIHSAQKMYAIKNIDSSAYKKVIENIKKYNAYQGPTLSIYKVPTYKIFKQPFWKKSFDLLPKSTREIWINREKRSSKEISPDQKLFSDWIQKTTGDINKAKIPILAGTDTPLGFLTPGFSLHYELELMVASGLTNLEAIATATINPSKYFRMQDSLGLLKPNFIADLIILNTNPLDEISNTKDIFAVIKDGNYLERKSLDSIQKSISDSR